MPKFLTKTEFIRLNNRAIKNNYNRSVYRKAYVLINETDRLPVVMSFVHEDTACVRCEIAITDEVSVWLDIDYDQYEKLDTYYYDKDTHHADTKPYTTEAVT